MTSSSFTTFWMSVLCLWKCLCKCCQFWKIPGIFPNYFALNFWTKFYLSVSNIQSGTDWIAAECLTHHFRQSIELDQLSKISLSHSAGGHHKPFFLWFPCLISAHSHLMLPPIFAIHLLLLLYLLGFERFEPLQKEGLLLWRIGASPPLERKCFCVLLRGSFHLPKDYFRWPTKNQGQTLR